jgi:hypothetical protein
MKEGMAGLREHQKDWTQAKMLAKSAGKERGGKGKCGGEEERDAKRLKPQKHI